MAGGSTIDFGNHRVGDVVNRSYQVNHNGTAGDSPQVRTAIQTSVNGGNITDSRLSGAGVTASNLAPIASGANSGPLGVTFTASSAGALVGQSVHIEDNFDNVVGLTLGITGAAYNPAVANVTPTNDQLRQLPRRRRRSPRSQSRSATRRPPGCSAKTCCEQLRGLARRADCRGQPQLRPGHRRRQQQRAGRLHQYQHGAALAPAP